MFLLLMCSTLSATVFIPAETSSSTSIAVVTSDKTQTRLRLIRDSPKSLVTRLNSLHKGAKSEDIARAPITSHEWSTLEFDIRRKEYFLIDRLESNIVVVFDDADYMNKTYLLFKGISSKVTALAYDWLRRSLYWADPSYQTIFRLSIGHLCEGSSCMPPIRQGDSKVGKRSTRPERGIVTSIIGDHLTDPCAVVVDPIRGNLYWADDGAIPSIEMSTLGGENRTFVTRGLIRPAGLTLDLLSNKLYWVERLSGLSVINSCQLTLYPCVPVRVSTVTQSTLYDMDFHKGFLIASDHAVNRLVIYDDNTGHTLRQNWAGTTYGIRVASMDRQPWKEVSEDEYLDFNDYAAFNDVTRHGVVLLASEKDGISAVQKTFAMDAGQHILLPLVQESGITTMAVDVGRRRLFYYSQKTKSIFRAKLPNKLRPGQRIVKEEIVTSWISSITGLAVDWTTGNLYWLDIGYGRMMVSRGDGSYAKVIHHLNISHPQDLVIHSEKRLIFWSETHGESYRIERSDLEGYNRMVVLNKNVFYERPHALAIDFRRNFLYWSDGPFLCRATLTGVVFEDCKRRDYTSKVAVKAMDVMHDYILWTDFIGGIKSADVDTDFPLTHATTPTHFSDTYFSDVIYYHASRRTREPNLCDLTDVTASDMSTTAPVSSTTDDIMGDKMSTTDADLQDITLGQGQKCSHLCFIYGKRTQCACATGYWLKPNGDCVPGVTKNHFIVFCDLDTGQLFRQFSLLPDYYALPVTGHTHAIDVAVDEISNKVFWLDSNSNMIHAAFMNGSDQSVVFAAGDSFNMTKIKLESASGLLYIVTSAGDVALMSLTTKTFVFILKKSRWTVKNIAIYDTNRQIYMTATIKLEESSNNETIHMAQMGVILQADMDGTHIVELLVTQGRPLGITVYSGSVIWTDPGLQGIYSTTIIHSTNAQRYGNDTDDVDNVKAVVTLAHLPSDSIPGDIMVYNDVVYFTDKSKQAIQRFYLHGPVLVTQLGFPYMNNIAGLNYFDEHSAHDQHSASQQCKGIWVPKPGNASTCLCELDGNSNVVTPVGKTLSECRLTLQFLQKEARKHGLCLIKPQANGNIQGGQAGNYVLPGQEIVVTCDPGYRLSRSWNHSETRECVREQWTSEATCTSVLSYTVQGNATRGYVIFTGSNTFVVPRNVTLVDVICIGGGGGGYDGCDKQLHALRARAGMGGVSKFGNYLRAYGGLGGSLTEGGRGGRGRSLFGGEGQMSSLCLGGGAAGETQPPKFCHLGHTSCLFCGAGGALPSCSRCPIRPGGCGGVGSETLPESGAADNYGGGATGTFDAGGGGGGGFSRKMIRVTPMEVIPIKVGRRGIPSAMPAGDGVVVVGWGDSLEKLINNIGNRNVCKPFTYKQVEDTC